MNFLNREQMSLQLEIMSWDQKETMEFISSEKRLLRPENLAEGSPGKWFWYFCFKK